ncbi:MAG: SymE family type I addiction module toxin [Pseudomonadota bacterium]
MLDPTPFLREYPAREDRPHHSRRVPWLQMRGDWLSAAGFDVRAPVRVRIMRGCLVLTVEEA